MPIGLTNFVLFITFFFVGQEKGAVFGQNYAKSALC